MSPINQARAAHLIRVEDKLLPAKWLLSLKYTGRDFDEKEETGGYLYLSLCVETRDYKSMPLNQKNSDFEGILKRWVLFCNFSQLALSNVQKWPARE